MSSQTMHMAVDAFAILGSFYYNYNRFSQIDQVLQVYHDEIIELKKEVSRLNKVIHAYNMELNGFKFSNVHPSSMIQSPTLDDQQMDRKMDRQMDDKKENKRSFTTTDLLKPNESESKPEPESESESESDPGLDSESDLESKSEYESNSESEQEDHKVDNDVNTSDLDFSSQEEDWLDDEEEEETPKDVSETPEEEEDHLSDKEDEDDLLDDDNLDEEEEDDLLDDDLDENLEEEDDLLDDDLDENPDEDDDLDDFLDDEDLDEDDDFLDDDDSLSDEMPEELSQMHEDNIIRFEILKDNMHNLKQFIENSKYQIEVKKEELLALQKKDLVEMARGVGIPASRKNKEVLATGILAKLDS